MAIRNIRTLGDEILRKKAKEVTEMTPRIQELIDDMFETMYEANGVPINITFTIPHPPFQYQEAFLQPYQHTLLHQDGLFHEEDILQEGLHPQL